MSKRNIPEINAGSMADIAFLLLIFFLVTTTMDKDQAYVRYIPKPILVPPDNVVVEERNILAIKSNSQNQILIRDEIVPMEDISDRVLKFFQVNEQKIVDYEYPFYSRTTEKEMKDNIKRIEKDLDDLTEADAAVEFITAKEQELDGWLTKRDALALYGGDVLPEISFQASMRIEVSNTTQYEVFVKIHSEIEEAINILRDKEAKRLFNTPYNTLKRKNSLDATGMDEIEKLELLEILYPARIIEVTPKR